MSAFKAIGFPANINRKAFVAITPDFMIGTGYDDTRSHVDVTFYLNPNEVRELVQQCWRALDEAIGESMEDDL
jgi:hypothetical protein